MARFWYTQAMTPPKRLHMVAPIIGTVDICIVRKGQILMLKRSKNKKAFPNWIALPGGHIEEGENPLAAALREAHEETGISIDPKNIQLKFIATHYHVDRNEQYMVFGFYASIDEETIHLSSNDEGSLHWMDKKTVLTSETVFPPVQYYLDHVLNKPGILYNNSLWEASRLVQVLSEHIDRNS